MHNSKEMEATINKEPKQIKLTPSIIAKLNKLTEEVNFVQKQAQNQATLILESFAQGSGIQENEYWTLNEDNSVMIIGLKEPITEVPTSIAEKVSA